MTEQPVLTIAVPTYNRAEYLNLCLARIGEEINGLDEAQARLVRVCVADNGSTDNTREVVSRYQGLLAEQLKSVRTEVNQGMDFNFTRCYELAQTPYVWLVGDDDIILPGGLKKVLDVLAKYEIDILYVNNYWFKKDHKKRPNQKEPHGTLMFSNALEFARRTNVMLTYLSGLVVRTGIGSEYRHQLAGSNIVQLSWVLPLLRDGKCFATIQDWVIAAKGSNSGGYELVRVFGNCLSAITDEILKDRRDIARAIQNGTIINFFPGFIWEFRKGSSKFADKEMAQGLKDAFGDNWRYYVFLAPLFMLPLRLSEYYYYIVRVLRIAIGRFVI